MNLQKWKLFSGLPCTFCAVHRESYLLPQTEFDCEKGQSLILTKTEMDVKILQLFKMFFDKSVAEISIQSCFHV